MGESSSYSSSYNYTDDHNYTCPRTEGVDPFYLATGIFYQCIFLVGVIGNGTVLYVITKFAKMKTVTNWYIFNLALSDMLFLTSIPLFSIAIIFGGCWPFGMIMCHVSFTLDSLNMYTGINCLVVMSVDRFIAVCCPMKASKYRNQRTALIVNVSVWVFSLICCIPNIYMHEYYEDRIACGLNYEKIGSTEVVATVHIVYMAMIGFFIPLVIIAVCYTLIVVRLRIVSIRTGKMEKSRKVNRLVLGVVLVFIACWGPFYTLRFIFALYSQITYVLQPATKYLFNLTLTIGYINSCANCFLYAFLSESFKKSFQAAWFCTRSRDINSDLTNSSGYVLRGGRRERMLRKEMDKLGCFRKWSKLRTDDGKFDDDNYLSGVQHNSYPLTSLTTAVSDACRSQE